MNYFLSFPADLNQPRLWLEKNEQGSVAAYLSMSPVFDMDPLTNKEVILLIDRSESMRSHLPLLKRALHACLTDLARKRAQRVTFNVVGFGSAHHRLFSQCGFGGLWVCLCVCVCDFFVRAYLTSWIAHRPQC